MDGKLLEEISYFWRVSPWYVGHMALAKICDWNFLHYKKLVLTAFSLGSLTFLMGWPVISLFLGHCALLYLTSLLQSTTAVWTVSITLLSTLNFEPFVSWMKALNTHDIDGYKIYLLMFTLALLQLRYTSFCLEKVKRSNTQTDTNNTDLIGEHEKSHITLRYGPVDMVFYVFYFPLFFTGPIMSYGVFSSQICQQRKSWTWTRVTSLCTDFFRLLFWAFINELCLHYFYFNALQHNSTIMQEINLWTMAGIGYCSGQFFMTKYTVMFGLPSIVAKTDDLEPPKGPKCISYIYLYTDMWKYFDRGMYDFMKRYIYVPLGGSRGGMVRQFAGSILCFTFVYYWHGSEYYAFLWTVFNFIGVTIEALGGKFIRLSMVKDIQTRYLTPGGVRRVQALAIVPLYVMSAFTAFCFFGGSLVGYTFYQRFIYNGGPENWATVFGILYCCIQVGMEVKRQEQRCQHTKQD
ncbi:protein-cysteine N-palmitoyltransferase HHAT-like isoform X2 [Ylistrum balloti]|uniref:protein-cysteine N-palmitoyltransferase HHAT-like isoform X2 n=1 Tax=Ylistrum balloti TaxID=509963 RepID=UPI0029059FE7|nr:protein-cysteine N-palmitoyltransferase HHAT-like isoform X2 [Ylistrum balloti]